MTEPYRSVGQVVNDSIWQNREEESAAVLAKKRPTAQDKQGRARIRFQ
jgi:hypothetical protein